MAQILRRLWWRATVAACGVFFLAGFTGLVAGARQLALVALLAAIVLAVAGRRLERSTFVAWKTIAESWGYVMIGLAPVVLVASVSSADLANAPLGVDEHRLADTVRTFFLSGEIPHVTVEDYPGIHYWLLVGVYLGVYLVQLLNGSIESFTGLDHATLVLAGRMLSAALFGASAVIAGLIVRAGLTKSWGLVTAGVIVVAPLGIEIAGQNRNESTLLLCLMLALLAAAWRPEADRTVSLGIAGFVAGLAAGVKYTGVFGLVPVLLAGALAPRDRLRLLAGIIGSFAIAILATQPFIFLDFPNLIDQLAVEVGATGEMHWSAVANPSYLYSATLTESLGLPLTVLAGSALILALLGKQPTVVWLLLALSIPYQLFMTNQSAQFRRWVYPLLPAVVGLGMYALAWVLESLRRASDTWTTRSRWEVGPMLTILVLAPTLWAGATTVSRHLTPTTYERVAAEISLRAVEGKKVLIPEGWLEGATEGVSGRIVRTDELAMLLEVGSHAVAAYDWIVVPEPYEAFITDAIVTDAVVRGDWGFGGSVGFDFVLAVPARPPLLLRRVAWDLWGPRAPQFLGRGWSQPVEGLGRQVRSWGRVYFPIRRRSLVRAATVVLTEPGEIRGTLSVSVEGVGRSVVCEAIAVSNWVGRGERCEWEMDPDVSDRPVEVTIRPANPSAVWFRDFEAWPVEGAEQRRDADGEL